LPGGPSSGRDTLASSVGPAAWREGLNWPWTA